MLAVIRIRGTVNLSPDHRKTLELLRLHKPNHAVLVKEDNQNIKMVEKVKDYVTYGELDAVTAEELIQKRGRTEGGKRIGKEIFERAKMKDIKEIAKNVVDGKKSLKDLGIKPVFRLSPPRKGHNRGGIKKSYAVGGVLGYRASDINELLRKMM